jgi:hypothetical protein
VSADTVTITYAAAFTARIVLTAELRRVVQLLNDSQKTYGGFPPLPGSLEYWTAKVNEVRESLHELGGPA